VITFDQKVIDLPIARLVEIGQEIIEYIRVNARRVTE
jgi:hypothetical protein